MCDGAAGCNTTECLWDAGDCGDILAAVLARAQLTSLGSTAKMGELVATQGGFVKQGMYLGIVAGLTLAACAAYALCQLRAKRRKMQLTNRKYTPYGQAADDFDDDVPRLASAVDDDPE